MTREQKKQKLQLLREVYLGNGEAVKGFTFILTVKKGGIIFNIESNLLNMEAIQAAALKEIKELEETV
jgi:hypothetical protein